MKVKELIAALSCCDPEMPVMFRTTYGDFGFLSSPPPASLYVEWVRRGDLYPQDLLTRAEADTLVGCVILESDE